MNESGVPDPAYVHARRGLLDALDALGPHGRAVILVGAQAVYLNVGEAREALSSYTVDADLALNPAAMPDSPALQAAMRDAGFALREQPGLWFATDGAEVDFLDPASIAGRGGRGANLGVFHDRKSALRAAGLEAALLDNIPRRIAALDPADRRAYTIAVAGPAALLVAKLHKIGERSRGAPNRLKNKDASDLFLRLRETATADLANTLRWLRETPASSAATNTALGYLGEFFTSVYGTGIALLRNTVAGI